MLEIKKDSRQVPSTKQVCSNKLYCDTLYAYLQCISEWEVEEDYRYIPCKNINFTQLGKDFGVSRQTLATKFNQLVDLKLVQHDQNKKRYILSVLPDKQAYLIPINTLNQLSAAFNERSISIYVYLFNRFIMNGQKPYEFTLEQLKTWVGISTKTRSNDKVINSILQVLFNCGLIEYKMIEKVDNSTNFNNIKTLFQLVNVSNTLKTPTVERIKTKDKKVINC